MERNLDIQASPSSLKDGVMFCFVLFSIERGSNTSQIIGEISGSSYDGIIGTTHAFLT